MIALPPRARVRFKAAGLVLWLLLFALALAWRAQNLDAFSLSNDEGAHLMWASLALDGYPLYSETQAVQAPLFLETVRLAFWLAGRTAETGRWAMLLGFGLLAVGLSLLAYRAGRWPAALAALGLLAVSPLVFTFSRLVMAEVPATGLAVSSVVLLFIYLDKNHKGWLLASGLALGLSFLTKALHPFVIVPVGLLLWQHRRAGWWALLAEGALWGLGVLLPLAGAGLVYDPAALYDQLVLFRGDLRASVPQPLAERWSIFAAFFYSHWSFWLLAFGGIIGSVFFTRVDRGPAGDEARPGSCLTLVWSAWLAAGLLMLAWHTPLFPHHLIVLLPPLILLGADLVARLGTGFRGQRLWRLALLAPVLGLGLNLPAMVEANQATAAIVTGGRETEALKLLDAVSLPGDFLMGDSQQLIFMAGRRTPPPLGDVALVAVKAGRQTSARMIALTEAYDSPAVVQWSLRLPWLPDYLGWVEEHYLARRVWDNDHIVYFGRRLAPRQPIPNERAVVLADRVALRGYRLDPAGVKPGSELALKVYWQALAPLDQDYTVFTQLLDAGGAFVAGWDSQPLGGFFPTSQWPPGEVVTDRVRLPLPAVLPAGDYTLVTGMYRLDTLERLPAVGAEAKDCVILTMINIE